MIELFYLFILVLFGYFIAKTIIKYKENLETKNINETKDKNRLLGSDVNCVKDVNHAKSENETEVNDENNKQAI